MRHRSPALVLLLLSAPARAASQYVATQDLSLKGIEAVDLLVSVDAGDLAPDSALALRDLADLELRKAGLVISSRPEMTARPDGRLRIVLSAVTHGRWTDDLALRIQVEQTAILARTHEPMLMVTWYAEETAGAVAATDLPPAARSLMSRGLERLLKAWLASNGH